MPVAAITLLSGFLMPLLASMVGGYQLVGEAETDTLKTWLMHSISRGGVVVSKWGVAIITSPSDWCWWPPAPWSPAPSPSASASTYSILSGGSPI
jgi:hypothetical protein